MMSLKERFTLYEDAWKKFGATAQMDMLIEEMAELTQAILKARRNGMVFSYSILEEFADVQICMEQIGEQMNQLGSSQDIRSAKNKKLEYLKSLVYPDV